MWLYTSCSLEFCLFLQCLFRRSLVAFAHSLRDLSFGVSYLEVITLSLCDNITDDGVVALVEAAPLLTVLDLTGSVLLTGAVSTGECCSIALTVVCR